MKIESDEWGSKHLFFRGVCIKFDVCNIDERDEVVHLEKDYEYVATLCGEAYQLFIKAIASCEDEAP